MLNLGWFGALLAGMLGLSAADREAFAGAAAGRHPVSAVGGFAAGLTGGLVYKGPLGDLAENVKLQVVMLGLLGLGVGLALGDSTQTFPQDRRGGDAGALGGVLAAVLYPVAASLLLPTAGTDLLIPAGVANRLLWLGISSGVLGLVVVGMTRE